MFTREQADALNREAKALPRTADDETPAVFIGGVLVYPRVIVGDDGRPVLTVTVDTLDTVPGQGVADGNRLHLHVTHNGDPLHADDLSL